MSFSFQLRHNCFLNNFFVDFLSEKNENKFSWNLNLRERMTERTNHCFSIQFKANNSLVQFFLVSNGSAKLTFTRSSCNWLLLSPAKTIPEFLNNHHSHPNGFYWRVTNTHGSSPQPTASRPPTCSLTTATGSNQVLRNRLLVQCNIFSLFRQSFS